MCWLLLCRSPRITFTGLALWVGERKGGRSFCFCACEGCTLRQVTMQVVAWYGIFRALHCGENVGEVGTVWAGTGPPRKPSTCGCFVASDSAAKAQVLVV